MEERKKKKKEGTDGDEKTDGDKQRGRGELVSPLTQARFPCPGNSVVYTA